MEERCLVRYLLYDALLRLFLRIGVRTASHLCLYDWSSLKLIRRIEAECKNVYWNESDDTIAVVTDDSFFVLRYNAAAVASAATSTITDDGIEAAFDVVVECKVRPS